MMFASVSVTERDSVVHACARCRSPFLRHPDGSVEPLTTPRR